MKSACPTLHGLIIVNMLNIEHWSVVVGLWSSVQDESEEHRAWGIHLAQISIQLQAFVHMVMKL
jgi:hypothetical protein